METPSAVKKEIAIALESLQSHVVAINKLFSKLQHMTRFNVNQLLLKDPIPPTPRVKLIDEGATALQDIQAKIESYSEKRGQMPMGVREYEIFTQLEENLFGLFQMRNALTAVRTSAVNEQTWLHGPTKEEIEQCSEAIFVFRKIVAEFMDLYPEESAEKQKQYDEQRLEEKRAKNFQELIDDSEEALAAIDEAEQHIEFEDDGAIYVLVDPPNDLAGLADRDLQIYKRTPDNALHYDEIVKSMFHRVREDDVIVYVVGRGYSKVPRNLLAKKDDFETQARLSFARIHTIATDDIPE